MVRSTGSSGITDDFADFYTRAVQVVPGYRELFGSEPTIDQLLAIIKQYSVFEWLSFLSRIHTAIAPPYEGDVERHKALFRGVYGPEVARRLAAFVERNDRRMNCLLFVESQISTLQQMVIMHAPVICDAQFRAAEDFDRLCQAALIIWDLMHPVAIPGTMDATLACLIQDQTRRLSESVDRLGPRAFFAYQLHLSTPSANVRRLGELFLRATGFRFSDYLAGGLSVATKEHVKTAGEIAGGWTPTLSPAQCPNEQEARCLEAFHRLRCGTIEDVRTAIERFDGRRPVDSFSLIGLRRFPIIEFPNAGRFVTNLPAAYDALFAGIRHAILGAVSDGSLPGLNVQELGGIYGQVFEDYVLDLLGAAFGDRLIRLDPTLDEQRADGLILYHDKVIVFEIKGTYPRAIDCKDLKTLAGREEELVKLGITQAAEQLARTIKTLYAYGIKANGLPNYDWTTTPIIPVIITLEPLPLFWQMGSVLEGITQPLSEVGKASQVARARFLNVRDAEAMPDLVQCGDVGRLLLEWANDRDFHEVPLNNYCNHRGIRANNSFSKKRFEAVMRFLIEEFGLDASKVKFSSSA